MVDAEYVTISGANLSDNGLKENTELTAGAGGMKDSHATKRVFELFEELTEIFVVPTFGVVTPVVPTSSALSPSLSQHVCPLRAPR